MERQGLSEIRQTQKERLAARREALLRAAAELFLRQGYERTSLTQIIKQAGGSKATVYEQFGDKAGLFRTVVIELCDAMFEPLGNQSPTNAEPRAILTEIGRTFIELTWGEDVRALSRIVYTEGGRNPEIADVFFENGYEEGYRQLSGFLLSLSENLSESEALELARMFFAMLPGDGYDRLLAGSSVQRSSEELERQIELSVEWLMWKIEAS